MKCSARNTVFTSAGDAQVEFADYTDHLCQANEPNDVEGLFASSEHRSL
jgi:hypothetical protein